MCAPSPVKKPWRGHGCTVGAQSACAACPQLHCFSREPQLCPCFLAERQWNMWIPGFGSEEIRPYKKACTTEAHKQVRSLGQSWLVPRTAPRSGHASCLPGVSSPVQPASLYRGQRQRQPPWCLAAAGQGSFQFPLSPREFHLKLLIAECLWAFPPAPTP